MGATVVSNFKRKIGSTITNSFARLKFIYDEKNQLKHLTSKFNPTYYTSLIFDMFIVVFECVSVSVCKADQSKHTPGKRNNDLSINQLDQPMVIYTGNKSEFKFH